MDQQGASPSPPRSQSSSSNKRPTEVLSPADEELVEKHANLLGYRKRLPALADHRFSLGLANARDEIKKPAAFARLLERINVTTNEAEKRVGNARSKRINSKEFQSRILPRVVGYSTLAAIDSLKEEAYARLLNELPANAEITKPMVESVAQGNPPTPKLQSALTIKFGKGELDELTPARQKINRKIIADIREALGRQGCVFQYVLRKDLLTLLGDTSNDAQPKESKKE
jgi:hypothetical protein